MSFFSQIRSHVGGILVMTSPAIVLGATLFAGGSVQDAVKSKYPPSEGPKYKPGDEVVYQGKKYTIEGYSGHQGSIAYKLDMARGLWITRDYTEAQGYATLGRNKGAVATIMHLGRSAESKYSRFDNAHAIHIPTEDHGYTVAAVEPVTESNNGTFQACFERMASSINEKVQDFFDKKFS